MSNDIRNLPSGWSAMRTHTGTPSKLRNLIDNDPYPAALAALKKRKEDCGYTDKWYRDERHKLNRAWLVKVQDAVQENQRYIGEREAEIDKVAATNFEHNYTERDYADLQFIQTLIKTRITAEGQNSDTLIERIVRDYINTQVGARAIMFLTGDSEVGQTLKPYYAEAAENAKTAAEVKFEADKAAELDKLDKALIPFLQADIIGHGMLDEAQKMVAEGVAEQGDELYFSGGTTEGDLRRVENNVFFGPL